MPLTNIIFIYSLFSTVLLVIPAGLEFYFLFSKWNFSLLKTYKTVQSNVNSTNTIVCSMMRNTGALGSVMEFRDHK